MRMPANVKADDSEQNGNDNRDCALTSSSAPSIRIKPTFEMRRCGDTYDEDESDSPSDDESPSSPESEDVVSNKFDDSESLDKSNITPSFQAISLGSKMATTNVESRTSGRGDYKVWAKSSSESSHLATSDEDDYSEDDLTKEDLSGENLGEENLEEDIDRTPMANIINKLKEFELDGYSNNHESNNNGLKNGTLSDDNYLHNANRYRPNISRSLIEEENDTSSDDDSENQFEARGIMRSPRYHHGSSPYSREQQEDVDPNEVIASLLEEYAEQLDPVLRQLDSGEDSSSRSPIPNISSSWDGFNISGMNNFDESPAASPEMVSLTVRQPLSSSSSTGMSYIYEDSLSPIPPSRNLPGMNTFSAGSFKTQTLKVPQPLSSGSSSTSSINYAQASSPIYENGIDQCIESNIITNFKSLTASDILLNNHLPTECGILSNGGHPTTLGNFNNIPTNISQEGCYGEQTVTQVGMGLNPMTTAPLPLYLTTSTPGATQIQKASLDYSTGGVVTVNSKGESVWIQNNVIQMTNSTPNTNHQMSHVLNGQLKTPPTSATTELIPTTVLKHSMQRCRNPTPIVSWPLLERSSTPVAKALKKKISPELLQTTLTNLYKLKLEDYAEQRNGDTRLMDALRDRKNVKCSLAKIVVMLDKMVHIPHSFTLTNGGYDALYLAAMKWPEADYVLGALLPKIAETSVANIIWQRRYGTKGDTIIHAVAAKGETHRAVLEELLNSKKFDLSAQNFEGKTALHVAVEAHDVESGVNSVATVLMLMKSGIDYRIKNNNGDTALHMAMSNTHCLGLVQALLHNGKGIEAINTRNQNGDTPLHLAVALLHKVIPATQEKVCSVLIVNGGEINIRNHQNKTPLALVAASRRERIEKILHKRL